MLLLLGVIVHLLQHSGTIPHFNSETPHTSASPSLLQSPLSAWVYSCGIHLLLHSCVTAAGNTKAQRVCHCTDHPAHRHTDSQTQTGGSPHKHAHCYIPHMICIKIWRRRYTSSIISGCTRLQSSHYGGGGLDGMVKINIQDFSPEDYCPCPA